MQMFSPKGHPGLFSATSTQSPHWRAVRKGTFQAFNPRNLRWACSPAQRSAGRAVQVGGLLQCSSLRGGGGGGVVDDTGGMGGVCALAQRMHPTAELQHCKGACAIPTSHPVPPT